MTINKYILLLLTASLFWLSSCIDEYWPEVSKYENLLVVDGGITNEVPPYTVKLSISSPINDIDNQPFTSCNLIFEDGDGNQEYLYEIEPGVYKTPVDGMQGEIGKKYKLRIQTPDGKIYESSFEYLKKPVLIDKIDAKTETKSSDNVDHDLQGYQFYVNTEAPSSDTNYYLWKLNYTYHYQSDYFIKWYFTGQLNRFLPIDSLYNCYTTRSVNKIYTYNTENITNKRLEDFPLNFVSTETRQLSLRYSLLVKQHTISKQAYIFWSALEKQNSDQGSLYSRQPFQIRGNIRNVNDAEEPVLGYFLLSGIDSSRIFVDRPNLPFYYSECSINEGNYLQYTEIGATDPVLYPVYVIVYAGNRAVPGQACADCRQRGGAIVKPEFWED
ncbi:MAG: hypothetical protein C0595_03030 [Marinilabiliales bacterium]|nr:MAG: hypothetical protein C0595_03030 [Marinilabiliales bacterium]